VREVQAPKFYLPNGNAINVDLTVHGQIAKFDVPNDALNFGVTVRKIGNVEAMPDDTLRWDITGIANRSNANLEDFYFHDALPADAVRADRIVTGTFNQPTTYKILYKTNLKEYRPLADNLSTQTNHDFWLAAWFLGLSADEYVTDVKFEFGAVRAGFAQAEPMYLYAKTLDWLQNEYRFENRADAGGRYMDYWVVGKDSWVSVVFRSREKVLPRTGW
jgi:hypothetical protein